MSNPYQNEVDAITALASAHAAVLKDNRDISSYSISKMLEAMAALSAIIIVKTNKEALPNE